MTNKELEEKVDKLETELREHRRVILNLCKKLRLLALRTGEMAQSHVTYLNPTKLMR